MKLQCHGRLTRRRGTTSEGGTPRLSSAELSPSSFRIDEELATGSTRVRRLTVVERALCDRLPCPEGLRQLQAFLRPPRPLTEVRVESSVEIDQTLLGATPADDVRDGERRE